MPLLAFDCGSQSINSVFTSAAANDDARLMAVVVFPTPPFWLATAMTRPIYFFGESRDVPQHSSIRRAIAMTDFSAQPGSELRLKSKRLSLMSTAFQQNSSGSK